MTTGNQNPSIFSTIQLGPNPIDEEGKIKRNKDGETTKNPAWTINNNILEAVRLAPNPDKIRILASLNNFEKAFLQIGSTSDKPYNAIRELNNNPQKLNAVYELLMALINHSLPVPSGARDAKQLKESDIQKVA